MGRRFVLLVEPVGDMSYLGSFNFAQLKLFFIVYLDPKTALCTYDLTMSNRKSGLP